MHVVCVLLNACHIRCCSCDKVGSAVNNQLLHVHFLNVSLNYSHCEGMVSETLDFGED